MNRRTLVAAVAVVLAIPACAANAADPVQHEAAAAKRCKLQQEPGLITVPLVSAGVDRPFLLHVPSGYNGRKPLPLVLNLHPSGGSGQQEMDVTQMGAAADQYGFAVAAPNGAVDQGPDGYFWNVPGVPLVSGMAVPAGTPDDERYLLDVIRTTAKTLCIDPDRIYLTGYSGGARMSSQMACDYAKKIAAIAPVAGLRAGVPQETSPRVWTPNLGTCSPKQPVSVQSFHGTDDTTNPFLGNDDARWGYSVEAALARWADIDRCKRGPTTGSVTPTVSLITYARCESRTTVELYLEQGGGHTWPGSNAPPIGSDNASALILRFFKKHSLDQRK